MKEQAPGKEIPTAHLSQRGYSATQIAVALYRLRIEADNPSRGRPPNSV